MSADNFISERRELSGLPLISKRTRDVVEGLKSRGYKVAVLGPTRAFYGEVKKGLLNKIEGLVVPVSDAVYTNVLNFVDSGDYQRGRVEGLLKDNYAYLLAYSTDDGRRLALVYSIYFSAEDYHKLEERRGGLNLFIASTDKGNYFAVRIRDVEWKHVIKRNTLLDALREKERF
ncbi:MAG: hypothetical protein DRJ31_03530 [Candidatus Methanomethylicota archaeon]|uniref:Uncharacterized protein n=1 Tax=Thermoproteota archaeon TaxID=2056631 RepID=A0A497ERR9_9CREN|nr:MAG: hypothetical protein DRJ31_03530 [Candidatus Verstraetearchaeota archaeon]RLE53478.1 MAG: hypothetical protein DRJ33_00860 [Candidatus Verstraetearchaeota archaeon]